MKLLSLTLQNFRCFPESDSPLNFHDQITVLAAVNGRGKSSILDAITVGLSPYTANFEHGDKKGFKRTDASLRRITSDAPDQPHVLGTEASYPVRLEMKMVCEEDQPISIACELSGPKGRTTTQEARQLKDIADELSMRIGQQHEAARTILPVISYYGTGRLHAQKRLTQREKEPEIHNPGSRTMGYLNCLSSESTYKHFAEWMKETTLAHLQETDSSYQEGSPRAYKGMLDGVVNAVQHVLTGQQWHDLRYSVKEKQLTVLEGKTRLPLASLSDGLRSIIAMIGDLAYRCIQLNPALGTDAPTKTPGIVLIDEIEMHLHPAWQQKILQQLMAAFPQIQFICTTHSPQILSTVRPESIRTIHDNGRITSPTCKTYGAESKRVLEELMLVESRPPIFMNELEEFVRITDAGDWESARYHELRNLLDTELGSSDPALMNAEIKRTFQQLSAE